MAPKTVLNYEKMSPNNPTLSIFFLLISQLEHQFWYPSNQLTNRDNKDDLTIDLSQCQLCKKKMKIDHEDWSHALTNLQIGFIDLVFFLFQTKIWRKKNWDKFADGSLSL